MLFTFGVENVETSELNSETELKREIATKKNQWQSVLT